MTLLSVQDNFCMTNVSQAEINKASRDMEDEMSLQDLTLSLSMLRENIRYLREEAIMISMPMYLKMRAAEKAAVAAIGRIVNEYGRKMPTKTRKDSLHCLPRGEKGSGCSKARRRSRLSLVCR